MRSKKLLVSLFILFLALFVGWNLLHEKIYVGDKDFIMHENIISPDGRHRIIKFEIDLGAWGSHFGDAITPAKFENVNLASYKIARCYEAFGWTEDGRAIIGTEKCNSPDENKLQTGEILQNVKVQVVNGDEFLLKQGIIRKKTVAPPSAPK